MGNVVDHIEPGDALGLEEIDGLALLFTKNSHQHAGTGNFLFAGRLDVKHRSLQDPLKAQGWLGLPVFLTLRNQRGGRVDKLNQVSAHRTEVGSAGFKHQNGVIVVEQGQQQVFNRHELMALCPRAAKGVVERLFQVFTQHFRFLSGFIV